MQLFIFLFLSFNPYTVPETSTNDASKEDTEEQREMTLNMDVERPKPPECAETDKEALKSALQAAVTAAYSRQSRLTQGDQDQEVDYVTKSEMKEVLKVCEDVVRDRILSEVRNSFFSLFIDRVVRFGETDYLPIFLRFVDSFDVMRLELMGFVEVTLDTEAICERLYDVVTNEWSLDLSYCRGQASFKAFEMVYCKVLLMLIIPLRLGFRMLTQHRVFFKTTRVMMKLKFFSFSFSFRSTSTVSASTSERALVHISPMLLKSGSKISSIVWKASVPYSQWFWQESLTLSTSPLMWLYEAVILESSFFARVSDCLITAATCSTVSTTS